MLRHNFVRFKLALLEKCGPRRTRKTTAETELWQNLDWASQESMPRPAKMTILSEKFDTLWLEFYEKQALPDVKNDVHKA